MIRKVRMPALVVGLLVLAVIAAGCAGPAAVPTPTIPLTLYENTEHGFSIEYPEEWTERTRGAGTYFSSEFKDPEGRLSASVSIEYRTEDIVLAELVSEGKAYMEAVPQFELTSEGDVTIGKSLSGYEMVGKGDIGTGKVEKFRFVTLTRGKQGLWVGVQGEPTEFDQQKQMLDAVVDSFKLLSTYTFVPPTPTEGGTYTNAEHGFSITYPAGWAEYTTGQYGEIVDLRSAGGVPEVMVRVWTEETTLDEAASKLKKQFSEHVGDYEFLSEGEITLDDGTPAHEIVFSGTMEGYLLTCKFVVVIREADVFLVQCFSLPDRFEQEEAVLDEVIHSFHLE